MKRLVIQSRLLWLLLVVLGTVGCDQATKHFARHELGATANFIFPGDLGEFRLAENPGAFLGLGANFAPRLRGFTLTVGVGAGLAALGAFLIRQPRLNALAYSGLALLLAGGLGNWIDRCTRAGLVTDFIILRLGPLHTGVFNVADVAVLTGCAMVGCAWWRARRSAAKPTC